MSIKQKVSDTKLQYHINRVTTKIYAFLSGQIDMST